MNEILVEINVPSIDKSYDVFIPNGVKIYELTNIISEILVKMSGGLFIENDSVLCNGDNGVILNLNSTPEDINLRNGSRLMLI